MHSASELDEFSDRMAAHAASFGDREAFAYTHDPDSETESLSFAQLHSAACRVGALIQGCLSAGDRAMLVYPPGTAFAIAFLGCLYAGVLPVVVPLPDGQRSRAERLSAIARDAEASALLTETSTMDVVAAWARDVDLNLLACLVTDAPDLPEPDLWRAPAPDLDRLAFLQYTSGSTSRPRGVMVTAANLAEHALLYRRLLKLTPNTRHGGWLPMHHDSGLIGLFLAPLYLGNTVVQMPAATFLRRPHSWLRLIDRNDLHVTSAPNFAYDMCLNRIDDRNVAGLDLSRLQLAINGAEPIQPRTLRGFLDRFARHGLRPEAISPGYGLAEATLVVSLAGPDRLPRVTSVDAHQLAAGEFRPAPSTEVGLTPRPERREIVGCGRVSGYDLRIVDPSSRQVLADGLVGEIWLRGSSVGKGYWRNEDASRETFAAITADGDDGYLRTGDLGVQHDGELYITGRIKEVLIVHGRNLYPHDIEAEARLADESLVALFGAAFTVPVPEEQVVLVHEVRVGRPDAALHSRVAGAIQRRLARELGIATNVVLVPRGAVSRTTSGKIRRVAMREAFVAGRLKTLHAELSPAVGKHLAAAGRPSPR